MYRATIARRNRLSTNPNYNDFLLYAIYTLPDFIYDKDRKFYSWQLEYWDEKTQEKLKNKASTLLKNWEEKGELPDNFLYKLVGDDEDEKPQGSYRVRIINNKPIIV